MSELTSGRGFKSLLAQLFFKWLDIYQFVKLDWRLIFIVLIITQITISVDLTHHIRTSYIYNSMFSEQRIILFDPQLSAKELIFSYGIPAYIISGLLWYLVGAFSVDLVMILLIIFTGFIVNRLYKKNINKLFAMCVLIALISTDSFIALFANTFFWWGLLLYKEKKNYLLPLIVASISHPFALIASIYFLFKLKKNLLWWVPIFAFYIVLFLLFPHEYFYTFFAFFKLILALTIRIIIFYVPFMNKKLLMVAGIVILVATLSIDLMNNYFFSFSNPFHLVFEDSLSGFLDINGILRVVDYTYLPVLSQLHKLNIILEQGSFFENNQIKSNFFIEWESKEDYFNYLNQNNISHVLFCKYCIQRTNEFYFFNDSSMVWENKYYSLFIVK